MLIKFKFVFAAMLIISMIGLGVISKMSGDWKACVLGVLYAVANVVIFIM